MAKKRPADNQHKLFTANGTSRRKRPLFLPRLLDEEGKKETYHGADQNRAHGIIQHWADLESEGHLERKETALDAEFLNEVFGEALGYKTSTANPDSYHLEREYALPGGGSADAALGIFPLPHEGSPIAVVELKRGGVDLDRDRSAGRTPVQQCWDYLNALPNCAWGIVSNFGTIRLYHRDKTPLAFEEFTLQEMRDLTRFRQFYCLFHLRGLVEGTLGRAPTADGLLKLTDERQRTIGDRLYESYSQNRLSLIYHLHTKEKRPLDTAMHIAQKLLDRIIFIAFCEDRELLPTDIIDKTWNNVAMFDRATNPRWRNFLDLFHAVDVGHSNLGLREGYDGGLFRHDPDVDELQLDDDWTDFFRSVSSYDFRDEVNVDVLGHLFERSITELEKMRSGGLFEVAGAEEQPVSAMQKSAERKRFGTYYTPPDFTTFIVNSTVGEIIAERLSRLTEAHEVDPDSAGDDKRLVGYWHDALDALRTVKVCDPACGSGAFLIAAYDALEEHYIRIADSLEMLGELREADELRDTFPDMILSENLFGVDVSPQAVEITQLALWLRSARQNRTLADLSANIVCGNSLADDPAVHAQAIAWEKTFSDVFARENAGFDCVIGNPPWERVKVQEREFFALSAPKIAEAVSAATRRKLVGELETGNPGLYKRYVQAKDQAERMLDYARNSGKYPFTGRGDINTYMLFAELARTIVAPAGLVGLLVPSGIGSDNTTREYFNELVQSKALVRLYDFENRKGIFADLHRSFKFCSLVFGGTERKTEGADFAFFAHSMKDLADRERHISLTAQDMALVNPNTRTCPIFRSRRDAQLTKAIYNRVPILVDETRESGGNPWGIKFVRMFDQTNDAELFHTSDQLKDMRFKRRGNRWTRGKKTFLPLYEAKMIQMYDHRAAGVVVDAKKWMRQGQTAPTSLVSHQNPEFTVEPRWWVERSAVEQGMQEVSPGWYISYKDVTSPTNERTMIAAFIPHVGVVNSAPLVITDARITPQLECCLLANLNTFVYDFVARQKIGGIHLNFFIVRQLPTLAPDAYSDRCPWAPRQTLLRWISQRVLKLTCTANDMKPLAAAAGFKQGIHKWKAEERAHLQAQLDAAYFLLYGIGRDDVEYILSTFTATQRRDEAATSRFQTADLILEAYDKLAAGR
ncbi:MAG: N-6 DNA methylase [Phycisphaerales bacterium]|nr:MAG: N-6 DNA methylase [Phycisphaerales bacterium]